VECQDVPAGGVGYVELGAGQVQIPNVWMTHVVDPFAVSHLGLLPELFESFTPTGQFADEFE
jgi:hypothetical protein